MAGIVEIRIDGLAALQRNLRAAPKLAVPLFQKALAATVFTIQKNATDEAHQFKTARALRTGILALSWNYPNSVKISGWSAFVGPVADYSPFVYFGHKTRGASFVPGNPFIERIAKASEPEVNKHFQEAAQGLADQIAKVS